MITMEATPKAPTEMRRRPVYGLLIANRISLVGRQLTALAIPWFVRITTMEGAPRV